MTDVADWPTVKLVNIVRDIQPGFATGKHNSKGSGLPHLRPMNVNVDGHIDRSVLKFIDPGLADRDSRRLKRGDVLFNNTNSPELVGKTAHFDDDDEPAFSNHMTRLRVDNSRADPAFLALRLHQAWREGWFSARCNNHVSQASIGRDVLQAFEFQLPPLEVQRALSAMIGTVENRRESAGGHLSAALGAVNHFRQAVLSAACSGRLTADWRVDHVDDRASPGLVASLAEKKRRSSSQSIAPPSATNADLFIVADEWQTVSLDLVAVRITSGSRDWSPYYGRGSGTFVMAQNVRPGRLDWSFRQSVDPPDADASRERSQIERGDLLVTIVGANTGDVGPVVDRRPEHYVCQSVALVRPIDPRLTPYLNLWFNSPQHGRRYFEECLYGAGRPHLSFAQLKSAPVALPTLAEQDEIVRRTEALLTLANTMSARIDIAADRVASSCQAILSKAFSGELLSSNKD